MLKSREFRSRLGFRLALDLLGVHDVTTTVHHCLTGVKGGGVGLGERPNCLGQLGIVRRASFFWKPESETEQYMTMKLFII